MFRDIFKLNVNVNFKISNHSYLKNRIHSGLQIQITKKTVIQIIKKKYVVYKLSKCNKYDQNAQNICPFNCPKVAPQSEVEGSDT